MSLQSFVAHQVHLPDDTLALALEGYAFIGNRCRALGTDVFETRIMLQRTICMLGAEAARMFYDGDRMQREGVIVRPMGGYKLPEWIRITIGTPQENKRCLSALQKALAE